MFIDYQDHVLDVIFAQDRRVIEFNARTLTKMAVAFKIPVILSTPWRPLAVKGGDTRSTTRQYRGHGWGASKNGDVVL
jgi:hypothetical protein